MTRGKWVALAVGVAVIAVLVSYGPAVWRVVAYEELARSEQWHMVRLVKRWPWLPGRQSLLPDQVCNACRFRYHENCWGTADTRKASWKFLGSFRCTCLHEPSTSHESGIIDTGALTPSEILGLGGRADRRVYYRTENGEVAYANFNKPLDDATREHANEYFELYMEVEMGLYAFINAQLESGQGEKCASNHEALEYGREHSQRHFVTPVLDGEYWVVDVADYYGSADYGDLKEAMRGPREALRKADVQLMSFRAPTSVMAPGKRN